MDAVISCAGASMNIKSRERASFRKVDHQGNLNLLGEARRAGVGKFVYVSLFGAQGLLKTEYAEAHEQFVENLVGSGLRYAIVRPTGFFSMFNEILAMARGGRGVIFGDGDARTNPIHQDEVAASCVEALTNDSLELPIGGPDVLTRREIVELAFAVTGRPVKIHRVPPFVVRAAVPLLRMLNPRVGALIEFGVEVSTVECLAPLHGRMHLRDYFRQQQTII